MDGSNNKTQIKPNEREREREVVERASERVREGEKKVKRIDFGERSLLKVLPGDCSKVPVLSLSLSLARLRTPQRGACGGRLRSGPLLYINGDFDSPNAAAQGFRPRVPAEWNANASKKKKPGARPLPQHHTPPPHARPPPTRALPASAQGRLLAATEPSALI